MSRQGDALRTGLIVIRAITLSLSVGLAHVLTLLGLAIVLQIRERMLQLLQRNELRAYARDGDAPEACRHSQRSLLGRVLVPRVFAFANPITYGIDRFSTDGKKAIGARAIPAALRIRLRNNLL